MSLQDFPVELILLIVSEARSGSDKQCLRIACRSLWNSIGPAPGASTHDCFTDDRDAYSYLQLLHKPGNVFSGRNLPVAFCGWCSQLKLSSLFPIKSLVVRGSRVCEACIFHRFLEPFMSHSNVLQYRGEWYHSCWNCFEPVPQIDLQNCGMSYEDEFGNRPGDKYERLCRRCHSKCCSDPWCHGWPEKCVRDRRYRGEIRKAAQDVPEYKCGCDDCSQTLSNMLREEYLRQRMLALEKSLDEDLEILAEVESKRNASEVEASGTCTRWPEISSSTA